MLLPLNFQTLYRGSGQQNIDFNQFELLNIPIPSIEIQDQVIEKLNDLSNQKKLLSDRQLGIVRQMKYYFEILPL